MSTIYKIVTSTEIHRFMTRCMQAVGTTENHADTLADCLMAADHKGHFSHGLNRLETYVDDIIHEACRKDGDPSILNETPATAHVDGQKILGPVLGSFCMNLAMKKAQKMGIGWIVVRGGNHFGFAQYYTTMAMKSGFIGLCMTNTSPMVVIHGGKKPFLGTNPLSMAAAGNREEFVLDMSTSVASYGKIELQARKGESIPENWAIDSNGRPTTDPNKVSALLPLGGKGGFKGTGLSMMVEILSAVLSGSSVAPDVRKWNDAKVVANLGHCFAAIDPRFFCQSFLTTLDDLVENYRAQEPGDGTKEILVAGDPEDRHIHFCYELGGIPYHPNQIVHAKELAKKLAVPPPECIKETTRVFQK